MSTLQDKLSTLEKKGVHSGNHPSSGNTGAGGGSSKDPHASAHATPRVSLG